MTNRFVIFCHARSGSTWLVNTLNNISGVTCYGELFLSNATVYRDGSTQMPRFLLWKESHPGIRPFSTFRYLNDLYQDTDNIGYKLMYTHLRNYPEIAPYLLGSGVRVIHLIRKNTLDSILSSMVARSRGQFHFKDREILPEEKPISVDPDYLIRRIRSVDRKTQLARTLLRLSGLKQIEVHYEDLLADVKNFKIVWQFLGVDFEENPPTWQVKKSRKKKRVEAISNYLEVNSRLASAGYAHFLED